MKVLLINGSPHEHGCTRAALDEVARTLSECGVETELINLGAGPFSGCRACGGCAKTGRCVIADDAPEITAAMHDADVIAFATPIYYYELSGQLKTLLDRSNSLFDSDYAFTDIYLFAAAAEEGEVVFSRAKAGLEGWIECFERAHLAGTAFAGGFNDAERAAGSPALDEARRLGESVK